MTAPGVRAGSLFERFMAWKASDGLTVGRLLASFHPSGLPPALAEMFASASRNKQAFRADQDSEALCAQCMEDILGIYAELRRLGVEVPDPGPLPEVP